MAGDDGPATPPGERITPITQATTSQPRRARRSKARTSDSPAPSYQPAASGKRYRIVCDACGKRAEIPFAPHPNRYVYCPRCHKDGKAEDAPVREEGVEVPAPLAPRLGLGAPGTYD